GAVRHVEVALERVEIDADVRRVAVQIAVAAGDADAGAGGDDARAGEIALVDQVAQVGGEERLRADVANGGEARLQRAAGVHHRGHRRRQGRGLEGPDVLESVGPGLEVDVGVDQAGEHRRAGEIDHRGAGRSGYAHGGDSVVLDPEGDVLLVRFGEAVEEASGFQVDDLRSRREGEREKDHALKTSSSS